MLLCVIMLRRGNCNQFPLFPFINTPLLNENFHIFHLPVFITARLPEPLLINQIFFGKSKLKCTGVDTARIFFQDAKSSLTKHKKFFFEAPYGTSPTSNLELF